MFGRLQAPLIGATLAFALVLAPASSLARGVAPAGLAYTKNGGGIWVAAANGTGAHRLAAADLPLLSPSGTEVAAITGDSTSQSLETYAIAGVAQELQTVSVTAHIDLQPLAWSPDSRYLAVSVEDFTNTSKVGHSAIEVIDTRTRKVTVRASGFPEGVSFKPGAGDTVVYSVGRVLGAGNLYERAADGSGSVTQLTRSGAVNPVWGSHGIVFDVSHPAKLGPMMQIAELNGSHITQITHLPQKGPVNGLVPIAVAANGNDLVADMSGTDADFAYAVDLATHTARQLIVPGALSTAFGISRDGSRVLVCDACIDGPPTSASTIATLPFGGGTPTVLARGATGPSWNQ